MADVNAIDDLSDLDLSDPKDIKTFFDTPKAKFIAANAQAQAQSTQSALQVHKLMDIQQRAVGDEAGQMAIAGNAQKVITTEREAAMAQVDAENAAAKAALTGNWTDAGSKANYWAAQMHENTGKAYSALDAIKEKESFNLLNNPLGFINAQFTLPSDKAAYNYYAQKGNVAESALNTLTKATTDAAIENNATMLHTSTASAQAQLDLISANTKQQQDKLAQDSAGKFIQGIGVINNLSHEQATLAYQVLNQQGDEQRMALATRAADDQHAMRLIATAQRQDALDLKTSTENAWSDQLVVRNIGARMKHLPEIDSVAMFKREYSMMGKNQEYQDMLSVGFMGAQAGKTDGVMRGQTAGDIARDYANPAAATKGDVAATYLAQVYNQVKTADNGVTKDKTIFNDKVTSVAVNGANGALAEIDDRHANIYAAPNVSTLLQTNMVKNSGDAFISSVLEPMVKLNPETKIPAQQIFSQATNFRDANGNTRNVKDVANGISAYFTAAVASNNARNQYVENGLPMQTKFMSRIGGNLIDVSDKQAVTRAVLMMRSSAAADLIVNSGGGTIMQSFD